MNEESNVLQSNERRGFTACHMFRSLVLYIISQITQYYVSIQLSRHTSLKKADCYFSNYNNLVKSHQISWFGRFTKSSKSTTSAELSVIEGLQHCLEQSQATDCVLNYYFRWLNCVFCTTKYLEMTDSWTYFQCDKSRTVSLSNAQLLESSCVAASTYSECFSASANSALVEYHFIAPHEYLRFIASVDQRKRTAYIV